MSVAPTPDTLRAPDVEVAPTPRRCADVEGADVLAVGVPRGSDPVASTALRDLVTTGTSWLPEALGRAGFAGDAGALVEVPWPSEPQPGRCLLVVGLGDATGSDVRRAGAVLGRRVQGRHHLALATDETTEETLGQLVEGIVLGGFRYRLAAESPDPPVRRVSLCGRDVVPDAVGRGVRLAGAGWYSRALALTPSNVKSPAWLVEQAAAVAHARGLELEVRDVEALRREGFGGLLGVGQASEHDPALVRLGYVPANAPRRGPHVVLVGKGITFDTGGLSLKPGEAMSNMKRDMTGAGVVLAAMDALAGLGCPVRVTGLLAIAENAVGGDALRPGDVIRHYGGRTTEVTNTDAEGRLVLADAMAYAVDQLEPTVLVDVATLTGAVRVALGQRTGGLFCDDAALAAALLSAAESAGEPLWRLPMVADYEDRIRSEVADADNAGGSPGAITAALFLRPFAADVPWAHLDLASVGDSPDDHFEWTQGATGFGARLLLRWLCGGAVAGG